MKGSIVKKTASRGYRFYVVTRERQDDGSYRQRAHGGYRTRKEADAVLRDILTRMDRGGYVPPSRTTVADYLRDWLLSIVHDVRPSTALAYRRACRVHVVPHLGTLMLRDVTAARLNALYATLLAGGLAPKSVRNVAAVIHKAFADAVDTGLIAVNPATKAKPPRAEADRRSMRTWSAAEVRTFLDHVRTDRLYAAWMLAASTGMRRGEVLGLRWGDVDVAHARLAVRQTLVALDYELQFSEPKTDKGRRTIDLDPNTVGALRHHRVAQAEERLAVGPSWPDTGLVFTTADGRPIHPHSFSQAFHRHAAAADLPRIRLHDLRHTHATLALRAGVPAKVVSERLGHSTVAFTLDTYTHAVPGMQAEAACAVAALVWGTAVPDLVAIPEPLCRVCGVPTTNPPDASLRVYCDDHDAEAGTP